MTVAFGQRLDSRGKSPSFQSLSQNFRSHNTCSDGLTGTAANWLEPGYFSQGEKSVVILPNLAIFSCIFLIATGGAFHFVGGRFKHPEKSGAVLITLAATLIGLNWLTNQGSQGSLPLWFSPLFIITAAMLRGRLLTIVTIYLTSMIAISFVLEWRLPQWVVVYGSSEAQLFDTGAVLLLTALICFSLTLFITYAYRQERDLALALEIEKLRKESLLDAALLETNQLKSLLPMCAWCKKIENVDGSWASFERYLSEHSKTDVTHGICPACLIEAEN